MTKLEFVAELEEVLEVDAGSLSGDTELGSLSEWDSLAAVSFIALADGMLGRAVAPADIAASRTVNDLSSLVSDAFDS